MITVDKLSFSYSRSSEPALSGVDLQISEGSLFGLLGPNGAGKTTLLSILSGLLPCPAGTVQIAGSDIGREKDNPQTVIALVPQNYAFYPTLSVAENLLFFARIQRISEPDAIERITEIAAIAGLEERLGQRVDRLSGGLKRRLNIAIGLLSKPQLLLLDEPTVGIDPHSRHFILEAIRNINNRGTTVIYTSHYMEEVEYLCDDIAIIDSGKVLVQDSLDSLLHADNKSRLIVDLGEPLSKIQDGALRGVFEFVEKDRTLSIRINHSTEITPVLGALEQNEVAVSRIYYGARNLEEVFLNFTNRSLRD